MDFQHLSDHLWNDVSSIVIGKSGAALVSGEGDQQLELDLQRHIESSKGWLLSLAQPSSSCETFE